jgi:methyltransferase (TIGR00027 family)
MEEGQRSLTAIGSAMMRAAHLLIDDDPKILRDELAVGLCGFESERALRAALEAHRAEVAQRFTPDFARFELRSLRAIMAVRNRYAEDELKTALQHGVTQYVLLGAGLDSFAYRRQDLSDVLRVFEVDHPATQQWKRARLHELNVTLPDNLTFVPIDFEKQTLRETLCAGGYRTEEPAFFSWLGVTQYLTQEATLGTLQEIVLLAPGSEIVFEYSVPEEQLDGAERQYLAWRKERNQKRGEPWVGFFDPTQLVTHMRRLGFTEVMELSPAEINARYFANRADGLQTPQAHHLMKARVGKVCKTNEEDKNAG